MSGLTGNARRMESASLSKGVCAYACRLRYDFQENSIVGSEYDFGSWLVFPSNLSSSFIRIDRD